MRKLFIIAALLAVSLAQAATVEYDPAIAARRQLMTSLVSRTVSCMRTGAAARLSGGERNDNVIAEWIVNICGIPLGRYMIDTMGFAPRDAAIYVFAMGHAAIVETPGYIQARAVQK